MAMVIDIFILCVLLVLPFVFRFGNRRKDTYPEKLNTFYFKYCLVVFIGLLIFYLIDPALYKKPDFTRLGKGIFISKDLLFYSINAMLTPLIIQLLPIKALHKKTADQQELFGEDVAFLPKSFGNFLSYFLYVIIAVVFEELFFRQFLFYSLNRVFDWQGDVLVIISAILFAVAHEYKRIGNLFFILLLGLALGKLYQHTESILYPILVHLCLNMTQVIMVLKRLLKKQP